ncbi:hypothetical protein NMYAN_10319 [Nitrosomonas nitrosa]|uniref:Uncharacterized protein n=1 Tax=Nitrosomonas nitrosa TaxID=52442 RepID=A0A8H9D7N0_9PROT|nr:hypothetical protein NMYAN_10319 [Nitrosomonas nitrosa]
MSGASLYTETIWIFADFYMRDVYSRLFHQINAAGPVSSKTEAKIISFDQKSAIRKESADYIAWMTITKLHCLFL